MLDRTKNPASYDYRLQGFSLTSPFKTVVNHSPVYLYSDSNIAISYIELVFATGRINDKNKAIAAMFSRLFLYLKTPSHKTLFEVLEYHGAKLSFDSSATHSTIKLYALSEDFEPILHQVKESLLNHNWSEESLTHCKNTLAKDLNVKKQEKKTTLNQVFNANFYKHNPLAEKLTNADVKDLTSDDIIQKINSLFKSLDFVLTVNVPENKLDLSDFTHKETRDTIPLQFTNRMVKASPKLNKEQSLIHAITPMCELKSKEYPLYYFYNQILGGSFQSILSQEIREKQGLTYGIHSSLITINEECYLSIKSTTPYLKGHDVLHEIDKIMSNLDIHLNEKYIDAIKKISSSAFLKSMENTFSQLSLQKNIILSGLEGSFYSNLLDSIKKISTEDILAVNDEILKAKSLKIVIE